MGFLVFFLLCVVLPMGLMMNATSSSSRRSTSVPLSGWNAREYCMSGNWKGYYKGKPCSTVGCSCAENPEDLKYLQAIAAAQGTYNTAIRKYKKLSGPSEDNELECAQAEAKLIEAQEAWDRRLHPERYTSKKKRRFRKAA